MTNVWIMLLGVAADIMTSIAIQIALSRKRQISKIWKFVFMFVAASISIMRLCLTSLTRALISILNLLYILLKNNLNLVKYNLVNIFQEHYFCDVEGA